MNKSLELDSSTIAVFAKHARVGVVMTIIGAAIVLTSLIFAGRQLTEIKKERTSLAEQLNASRAELAKIKASQKLAEDELKRLQLNVKGARASSILVQRGLRQFFIRDYSGAIQYYDKAITLDGQNPVLFDLRGYALLRSGDIKGAIESLKIAVLDAPDYVWAHYNLALAYGKSGDLKAGLSQVREVVKIDPEMRSKIRADGQFRTFKSSSEFRALIRQ